MIEREARVAKERPIIAAVIQNRLSEDIPLGIDATIRYAHEQLVASRSRESELKRDSPYNTRLHRGLPPTPIGNPGLASIQAAANPAKRDYLFYVVKPGTCGQHAFSTQRRAVREGRRRLQRRAPGERRQVPDEVLRRLGVFGWPVAHSRSPAMHRAALAAAGLGTGATSGCRCRPSCSTETARALGAAGFRGRERDDPAQGGRARDRRRRHRLGAGDRRREHAHATARTARSTPTTPTPRACSTRSRGDPRADRGRARRRRQRARRGVGAAHVRRRTCRSGTARPSAPPRLGVEVLPAGGPVPAADLLVNCTSVGLGDPSSDLSRNCRFLPMRWARTRRWWTWSTGPAERHSSSLHVSAA